jgi:hypothetical protein
MFRVVAGPDGSIALFFFFSNRAGCGTSLLITAIGTLFLLWMMGMIGG